MLLRGAINAHSKLRFYELWGYNNAIRNEQREDRRAEEKEMVIQELADVELSKLLALYDSVGWTNYTQRPGMLKKAYENSLLTLGAYDGGKLVGVIRTVGDGVSVVFIQDILVYPEYQRRGIGTRLLRGIMERFSDVYQMELMTDNTAKTISFYQSVGFVKADDVGCCAFMRI